MPKLIDYPRTSYTGAWELTEVVDDTGGKCAIETAAKKLNRKVSGSFKAIIGSAVKFGLITSKRDLLTTTTLFKRIKHAYDKTEELQFHREAFLTPLLFTQLCRKFRNRELPIQMLDVMLIREFGVEEINAQGVSKAFVDGCRMCALIDEKNVITDIDALHANRSPRLELSSSQPQIQQYSASSKGELPSATQPVLNLEKNTTANRKNTVVPGTTQDNVLPYLELFTTNGNEESPVQNNAATPAPNDAVASLFGIHDEPNNHKHSESIHATASQYSKPANSTASTTSLTHVQASYPNQYNESAGERSLLTTAIHSKTYQMQMSGPGVNTSLDISEEADISIAIALLEKIRRQLRQQS